MLNFLEELDTKLLLAINGSHCSFCDYLMFRASDKWIWVPFYFFLAFILLKRFKSELWKIILSAGVLILLSDQLSGLIKNYVMRYRPCHNLNLQPQIHLVNEYCGGMFGFVSSHAANSFALMAFIILLIKNKPAWLVSALIGWCLLVSYSRIYLAAHYPSDIAGGWIVGWVAAIIIFNLYKRFLIRKT